MRHTGEGYELGCLSGSYPRGMRELFSLVVELDLVEIIKSRAGLDIIKVKNIGSATSRLYIVRVLYKALDISKAVKVFKENREIKPTIFHACFVTN